MKTVCRLAIFLGLVSVAILANAGTPAESCQRDLAYIPEFLLANDTGAPAHFAYHGREYFDRALADAMARADNIGSEEECGRAIWSYLQSWRKGHLFIQPVVMGKSSAESSGGEGQNNDGSKPRLELLSDETALLTIPSFQIQYLEPLEALFASHKGQLEGRPNWIIDVRRNNGGTDKTYSSLLEWLISDQLANAGVEWRVTPANIRAQRGVCEFIGTTANWCAKQIGAIVKRMEQAPRDSYVSTEESAINYKSVEQVPGQRPDKVAILVGKGCVSSCEQFLLAARQSFRVKLIGRPSFGALDYSNLRSHTLPSGRFRIMYATSRSLRLPDMPVDVAGVMPDIYLPKPKNEEERRTEVLQVQSWVERGRFEDKGQR